MGAIGMRPESLKPFQSLLLDSSCEQCIPRFPTRRSSWVLGNTNRGDCIFWWRIFFRLFFVRAVDFLRKRPKKVDWKRLESEKIRRNLKPRLDSACVPATGVSGLQHLNLLFAAFR